MRNKKFYKSILILLLSFIILLMFSSKSEASIADFVNVMNVLKNNASEISVGAEKTIVHSAKSYSRTIIVAPTYSGYSYKYSIIYKDDVGTITTRSRSFYLAAGQMAISVYQGSSSGGSSGGSNSGGGSTYVPPADTTPPSCTISVSPSSLTNASQLSLSITFSESVSGFTQGDITLSGGSIASFSGSGRSYSAVINTQDNKDYTLGIQVGTRVCTDAAGNGNNASNSLSVPIDRIKPAISFTSIKTNNSINSKYASKANEIEVKFTASDNNYQSEILNESDITVKVGGITQSCTKTLTKETITNGVNYTLKISNLEGNGQLNVIIPKNVILDKAGNYNVQTESLATASSVNITIDNTKPEVKTAKLSCKNPYGYVKNGETVTLDITFTEDIYNTPTVKIGGRVATTTWDGKQNLTATYTISEKELSLEEGSLSIEIENYYDIVKLYGDKVTKTTDGSKVIYDRTPPKVDSIDPNGNTTWQKSHSTVISVSDNFTTKKDIAGNYEWVLDTNKVDLPNKFINEGEIKKSTGTGKFRVYCVVTDLAGNETTIITNPFYIDNSFTHPGTMTITKDSATGIKYITHSKTDESGTYYEGRYARENLYLHKNDGIDEESGHKKTVYQVTKLENGKEIVIGGQSIEDTIIENDGDYKITVTSVDNLGNIGTIIYIIHRGSLVVTFSPNGNSSHETVVSTKVNVQDSTGLVDKIYYEWVQEGQEPGNFSQSINDGDTVTLSGVKGNYILHIKTVDKDGNINYAKSKVFKITSGISEIGKIVFKYNTEEGKEYTPDTFTNQNIYMKIQNHGSDEFGGKVTSTYKVTKKTESGTEISIGEYSNEATVLTKEGEYTVTLTSSSEIGTSASRIYKVKIDKTEPQISFLGIEDYNKTGQINVNVSDTGIAQSGVNEETLRYYWTRSTETPAKEEFFGNTENNYRGKLNSTSSVVKGPKDVSGIWYLWIYAEDNVGNVNIKSNIKVDGDNVSYIDNEPPIAGTLELTEETEEKKPYTENTYTAQSIRIHLLNGYDADSGIKSNTYFIKKDGSNYANSLTEDTVITENGIYTVTVETVDNKNNKSTREYTIKIDKNAPTIQFNITNLQDYSKKKEIEVAISDGNGSGVNNDKTQYIWIGYEPSQYKNVNEVIQKINELKENAGDKYIEELEKIGIFYANQEVKEGKISTPEQATGIYHLYVYTEDNVGNTKTAITEALKLDNTNPSKPDIIAYENNSLQYYYGAITNENIKIEATNSKSLSGVDKYLYSISEDDGIIWSEWKETEFDGEKASVVITENGIKKIKMKAVAELLDGNLESEESEIIIVRMDKKGPDCTFANYETGENGTSEYVKDILVRVTLTEQNDNTVNPNTLKYEWVKFESIEEYNQFANKENTFETLRNKMTDKAKVFSNGEELPSPQDANGIYSMFVYSEDITGNASIHYSNIYKLGNQTANDNEEGIIYGDINGDGEIDIIDLSRLQQYIIGNRELSQEEYMKSDVNRNGSVDISDLSKMMFIIAGF